MTEYLDDYYEAMVNGTNGILGQLKDFHFDDRSWKIHAAVLDTGVQSPGKHMLILPCMLGGRNAEGISADFIGRENPWATSTNPPPPLHCDEERQGSADYIHSRSTRSLEGRRIECNGGVCGTINGFMVDRERWEITHIVTSEGTWHLGSITKIFLTSKITSPTYNSTAPPILATA